MSQSRIFRLRRRILQAVENIADPSTLQEVATLAEQKARESGETRLASYTWLNQQPDSHPSDSTTSRTDDWFEDN